MIMNKDSFDPRALKFITMVLAVSFLIGTITHSMDIFQLGFFGYTKLNGVSQWNNVFWTALVVIDPLVIFFLIIHRRVGALLGFLVLAADVAVNYRYFSTHLASVRDIPAFSAQSACLLFSTVTLPLFFKKPGRSANPFARSFSAIPYFALFLGLFIRLKGLFPAPTSMLTLWKIWVHCSMIMFDTILLIAFFMKLKAGFWAGILAFGAFALLQMAFLSGNYFGLKVPFTIEMGMTVSLCCLSIAALLNDREKMTVRIRILKK